MQNNKQILKLLLASTAAAVVVSCGSGSSDKSDPEPSSTSTPSATTTPAPTMTSTPTQSPTPTGTSTPTPTQTPAPSNTATPAPTGTSSVTIDPLTHQFYGNSGSLDRKKYFVMHGNLGGSSEINVDELAALKERFDLYQGRQFWSPLSQPVVKSSLDKDQGYPATTTAVSLGQKVIAADNKNPKLPYVSNRLVVTDQPRSPLHKNNDPVEGARWAADYFTHYFDDTTRPLFYEPMNEPFVHAGDFKAEHGPEEANVRAYMTTWFNEIGKEFDKRPELANVNVIGFASAWPSMELWDFNHWRDRMKMFMDNAGPNIDSFSVHLYDGVNIVGADSERTGSNSQAILDLIETYSAFKWDVVKPHSITEYGAIVKRPDGEKEYNEQVNSQTVRSFNGIMMELMERDDRLLTSIPFITDHSTWYWQDPDNDGHSYNPAMWRPNRNNIQLSSDKKRWEFKDPKAQDNYLLNANHLFFEFWKDVRGLRIAVDNLDPDLQVAAFIDGPTAYIVLNNLEHVAKNIQLNLAEMLGYDFSRVEIERLTVPRDAGANLKTEDITANGDVDGKPLSFGSLTMAAGEAVKFTITLDKPISPDNALKRATYYSDTHLQTIAANQAIDFKIENVDISSTDASSSTAMLRMSISRKHARSKQPTLTVNGTAVSVPGDWAGYDQADRDDFFGSIDIPVAFDLLTEGTNTVAVTFPDSSGRVSSMILEVNKPSEPVALASIDLGGDTTLSHDGVKQLNAKLIPTGASTALTWTSSDNAIVKVNKNGFLTAVSEGTATVTAVSTNSVSASISVTVNPKPTSKTGNLLENSDPEFESAINNDLLMERTGGSQMNVAMFEQRAGIGEAGTGGLFVNNTAGSLKLLYTDAALIDDVDTTKTYRIEFRAKVVSGEHVFWSQIPGSTGWKSKALTVTPDWQTVFIEYSGTGLPEGFTVPIHLDPAPSKQGGEVHIDNVKFYAVN